MANPGGTPHQKKGVVLNSLHFLSLAVKTCRDIKASTPHEDGKMEALGSVVFAAAALEAFINERAEIAAQVCALASQNDAIVAFSNVMKDAEASRASVPANYQLARWIL